MNKPAFPPEFDAALRLRRGLPEPLPTTQGAQDWPRLAWSLAMFDRAIERGLFDEMDHIELIGGELVPMASKGNRHERVRYELSKWMRRRLGETLYLDVELGWRPGNETYLEPDILVFADDSNVPYVPVNQVRLLIEVSHSSLSRDLGLKTALYASLDVQTYWVVNAVTLAIRSHEVPSPSGFTTVIDYQPGDLVAPSLAPELALRMADLGIDPYVEADEAE